jgi:hypothetical protein
LPIAFVVECFGTEAILIFKNNICIFAEFM